MSAPAAGAVVADGAADPGSALVGTVLAGRYRILRKLGEGAMGAVYLGEHLHIGRRDAIKVLRESLAADPEAMARFARGTRNVSLIQHPNVCTVYDFGDMEDGRRFLAMEYVPGETLQDVLAREGRLAPARAVRIAVQVAGALQAAHDAGIVHRDLKPGNVMVSPGRAGEDVVKVVDFDIAKGSAEGQAGDVTRLGFVIGTPEYMSPEQLLGMALDGRSDVYSLALVLFRMLAGALPFRAQDTQELMVQRLTGTPLRLAEVLPALAVPPALQAALDRALEKRAEDRFAGAAEFADAVTRAVADAPAAPVVRSDAPPAPSRLGRTHGTVPRTMLTPERGTDGGASVKAPHSPRTLSPLVARRASLAAAVLVVAAGGVLGVSSVLGPPAPLEQAVTRDAEVPIAGGLVDPPPPVEPAVRADSAAAPTLDPSASTVPAPLPTTRTPVENSAPAAGTRRAGGGTAGEGRRTEAEVPERPVAEAPRPRSDPPEEAPSPRREGITTANASAVAGRLSGHLTSGGVSRGTLRAVADSARQVLALGGVPARDRANAAYVLGVVAYREADWGECIRRLEQAEQLNPASTRRTRVMLDACRERQE